MRASNGLDRNGLAVLTPDECRGLLSQSVIGRIGLTVDNVPLILPVNFALLDGDIVIRTGWGAKLDAAASRQVVCFETDGFNPLYHSGWSVLVTGRAEVIRDPDELEEAHRLPLRPWAPRPGDHYIRIRAEHLSGRRSGPALRSDPRSGFDAQDYA
jgi:nitroimidazol reductase NimA-like FMN-containing flavoprotein (pyridoxamine 5'-phosphate oxidase superfamily)